MPEAEIDINICDGSFSRNIRRTREMMLAGAFRTGMGEKTRGKRKAKGSKGNENFGGTGTQEKCPISQTPRKKRKGMGGRRRTLREKKEGRCKATNEHPFRREVGELGSVSSIARSERRLIQTLQKLRKNYKEGFKRE